MNEIDWIESANLSTSETRSALMCYLLARYNARRWLGFRVDGSVVIGYSRASGGGYFARKFVGKNLADSFELAMKAVTNP